MYQEKIAEVKGGKIDSANLKFIMSTILILLFVLIDKYFLYNQLS